MQNRFPRLGAIPRVFKGFFTDHGDEENWTWYDQTGNVVERDPYTNPIVYDAFGKRHVFAKGMWREDDPGVSPLATPILTTLQFSPGTWQGVAVWATGQPLIGTGLASMGTGVGLNYGEGQKATFVDMNGNYLGDDGMPLEPGTYAWMQAKWGEQIPDQELAALYGDEFDLTPEELVELDDMEEQRQWYNSQGLVRIGQPPTDYGKEFYINGQRAIMGKPDGNRMQYAVTQAGEGDRWKYKIAQDKDGNWVRTYYRTFGAVKEKQLKQEKKEKKGKK